jgi:uncharacterized protein (TIRG00374 family)
VPELARLPARRAGLVASGLAISVFFGWLAVRGVHLGRAWAALRASNPWWLVPALGLVALTVLARAERWRVLFAPERRPGYRPILYATLIGYLFNNILPARAGEAARVVALNQRSRRTSRAEAVATIVVERVFDVASLLVLLFVLAPWYPHVGWFRTAAIFAIALGIVVIGAVVALALFGERALHVLLAPFGRLPLLPRARLTAAAENLTHGLAALRRRRVATAGFAWTIVSWLVLAGSSWCVLRSFHLGLSPVAGLVTVIAWNLAAILPSSPAGLGVFEAAVVAALGAYDVSRSSALTVALVLHALNFVPFIVVGALALSAPRPTCASPS